MGLQIKVEVKSKVISVYPRACHSPHISKDVLVMGEEWDMAMGGYEQ